jgi:hypothetical protein
MPSCYVVATSAEGTEPMASKKTSKRDRTRAQAAPATAMARPPFISAHAVAWAVLAALAVALLQTALGPHRIGDAFAETDFYGGYVEGARLLRHGHIDPARYGVVGPVYEVALMVGGLLGGDLLSVAELIAVIGTVTGVALWMQLLRRRATSLLALVVVLFLATNPTLFRYGYSATNDGLAFALSAGAMFTLLALNGLVAAAAAGILAALAFLTRYPCGILAVVGVAAILRGGTLHAERGRAMLAFLAGFLLLVVPWVLVAVTHGGTLSMQFHHDIAFDVYARPRGMPWDDYQEYLQPQFKSLFDVVAKDPAAFFGREAFNLVDHLRLDAVEVLGIPVAACAVLGLVAWARDRALRSLWPIGLMGALVFLGSVPFFHSERYSIPLLPAYALLAASTFTAIPYRNLWDRWPSAVWIVALLVPLSLSTRSLVIERHRALSDLPWEALETAQTLKRLAAPGDGVISRKPHLAYHAQVRAVPFPFTTTLPQLAEYAARHHARWLYVSRYEAQMRPAYLYLLDTTATIPGLERRAVATTAPAVLYEIGGGFGQEPAWIHNDTLLTVHAMRAKLWLNPNDVMALTTLAEYDRIRRAAASGP